MVPNESAQTSTTATPDGTVPASTTAPPPAPPAQPTQQELPLAKPSPTPFIGDNGEQILSDKLKERIERAKEQERTELLKALGVKSVEDAKAKFDALAEKEKQAELERLAKLTETQRLEEVARKEKEAREAAEREKAETSKQLEDIKRRIEVREWELKLNREALTAGVRPDQVDYALIAYQRELEGKTDEQLVQMQDPKTWFATELKRRWPHIFADYQPAPLTTGAPPTPKPTETTPAPAAQPKDAWSMSPEEWAAHKAKLGVGV